MKKDKLYILDTNTLISAFLLKNSIAFKALEYTRLNGLLLFSTETFIEFELVLLRKKFDKYFSEDERIQIIDRIASESLFKSTISHLAICRDKKDDKFLELAFDGNANCIITGDKDLLVLNPFENIPIISPSDFINSLLAT